MTNNQLQTNSPEYTVSEIASGVKRVVEDNFGFVRVRGEISAWKPASSGHCYFRLKDENAALDAICWKGTAAKIPFKVEDGMEVVCHGRMTTYPARSNYQLIVERMEMAGAGALLAMLEQRKQKLAAEGLFAPERKRPLPYLPRTIGVITSPTGAVIRDILHRIEERFPVHVLVWPVLVQGEGAAEQIAAAIEGFNTLMPNAQCPTPDLLIVARGGGSIEDLWAFNEEIVVRAAANSKIPLISAVGHETDTTLIDYASDKRAPTPTAAAEMAVPVREELRLGIMQMNTRLHAAMQQRVQQQQKHLELLGQALPRPTQLLESATQRLDDWSERLSAALPNLLKQKEQKLQILLAALKPAALLHECTRRSDRLTELHQRATAALQRILDLRAQKLESLTKLFESLNYKSVLARGYAVVKDAKGKLVATARQAAVESSLTIVFADGEIKR